MTPITEAQIRAREREELATRFFTFLDRMIVEDDLSLPEWADQPADYF